MPVMDGFETLSRVRSDSSLQAVPFIVISGSVSDADEDRAKKGGANSILFKPFSLRPLMDLVQAELGAFKSEPSSRCSAARSAS
jgi:CheY-like chemotaxis protein